MESNLTDLKRQLCVCDVVPCIKKFKHASKLRKHKQNRHHRNDVESKHFCADLATKNCHETFEENRENVNKIDLKQESTPTEIATEIKLTPVQRKHDEKRSDMVESNVNILKQMLISIDQNLTHLEACRRDIICQLQQQQQPLEEPLQKLREVEKQIPAKLSGK